jgi:hypothetical protein
MHLLENVILLWKYKYFIKHKTAFLCSRKCPSDVVLKSLDRAIEQKNNGECVISGFHSRIEKDIFIFF